MCQSVMIVAKRKFHGAGRYEAGRYRDTAIGSPYIALRGNSSIRRAQAWISAFSAIRASRNYIMPSRHARPDAL